MDVRGYRKTSLYCKGDNPEESRAFSIFKRLGRRKMDFLVFCVALIEETYNVDLSELSTTKILALGVKQSTVKTPTSVFKQKRKTEESVEPKAVPTVITKQDSPDIAEPETDNAEDFGDMDIEQAQLLLDGLDIM